MKEGAVLNPSFTDYKVFTALHPPRSAATAGFRPPATPEQLHGDVDLPRIHLPQQPLVRGRAGEDKRHPVLPLEHLVGDGTRRRHDDVRRVGGVLEVDAHHRLPLPWLLPDTSNI